MSEKIFDFAIVLLGYTFRTVIKEFKKGNCAILQTKNIDQWGDIVGEFPNTLFKKIPKNALIEENDVIVSNRGNFKSALFKSFNGRIIANSSVYILRIIDKKLILPDYLSIYLNSRIGQSKLNSIKNQTLIKSISKKDLMNLRIQIPSLEKQMKIVNIYKSYKKWSIFQAKRANIYQLLTDYSINKIITS